MRDQSAPGRTLWLVRHGESSWNAAGLVQGQRDGQMLTLHGRHQARRVAKRLASQSIASIVSSDLQRALQTAMPLSKILDLKVESDPRLRERSLGAFEGLPIAALTPEVTGIVDGRIVDTGAKPEDGESLDEFHRRV